MLPRSRPVREKKQYSCLRSLRKLLFLKSITESNLLKSTSLYLGSVVLLRIQAENSSYCYVMVDTRCVQDSLPLLDLIYAKLMGNIVWEVEHIQVVKHHQ